MPALSIARGDVEDGVICEANSTSFLMSHGVLNTMSIMVTIASGTTEAKHIVEVARPSGYNSLKFLEAATLL